MKENCGATIHFTDGGALSFDFSESVSAADQISTKIQEFFKYQYFMIEAEDSLLFFPLRSIKYIEAHPVADVKQNNIIKGAKAVS
jgi:hypothetical protein